MAYDIVPYSPELADQIAQLQTPSGAAIRHCVDWALSRILLDIADWDLRMLYSMAA